MHKTTSIGFAVLCIIRLAWSGCAVTPRFETKSEFVDSVLSKARNHPGYLFSKPDTFTIHKDTSWQDYKGTKDLRVVRHRVRKFMAAPSEGSVDLLDTSETGEFRMTKEPVCVETRVRGKRGGRCSAGGAIAGGSSSSCPGPVNFRDRTILVFTSDSLSKGTRGYGFCEQWSRDRNWFFVEGDSIVDRCFSMGVADLGKALQRQ